MNSLKVGILGLFIILPFLFISLVQIRQVENRQKAYGLVERAAERAMRDGVFALKTYSRFAYDADQVEKIEIAEGETIATINRSFAYGLNAKTEERVRAYSQDIRLIGFVAYDALILYDQQTGERLEIPFFQLIERENTMYVQKLNVVRDQAMPPQDRKLKIEQSLIQILQPYIGNNDLFLPEHKSTLYGNSYSEVGVFLLIQGDPLQIGREGNILKIGKVSLSQRKKLDFIK